MRRRAAAALLCGPLVAGCGTAARVDFRPHTRPASPLAVSVMIDAHLELVIDPTRISPGPVLFNVINQSRWPTRFWVRAHGHAQTRTPMIAHGATAQLKATLSQRGVIIGDYTAKPGLPLDNASTSMSLNASGHARGGDNELTQP